MTFLSAEKVWNGDILEYQLWFGCDNCEEPIFEGWPHWSNSKVPEERRGYVGPTELPPQKDIDEIYGIIHYCLDCGYKLGHISKREFVQCTGIGIDPADINIIENDNGELLLEFSQNYSLGRSQRKIRSKSTKGNKRQGISKALRFDVYKKCSFRCHYCGIPASDAQLEIDHVVPVSKGGTNHPGNLVAACFDCNRGKSDTELNA